MKREVWVVECQGTGSQMWVAIGSKFFLTAEHAIRECKQWGRLCGLPKRFRVVRYVPAKGKGGK